MNVLVCNAGSTSLKFKLFDMRDEKLLAESKIERVGSDDAIFYYRNLITGSLIHLEKLSVPTYTEGIRMFLDCLLDVETGVLKSAGQIDRVGFKTVLAKGCYGVCELTDSVIRAMEEILCVAPAHNGPYLEAIARFRELLPEAVMVGAFETAFHTTIPLERRLYPVPCEWYETYGIQRMGYHGASHSYIAETMAARYGLKSRIISCHLGGSCSVCAIENGESRDTSFGFSLQTGVFHANRAGDVDAYLFPFLMSKGLSVEEICDGLDKRGGLLGLSGISGDLRKIQQESSNPRARLAVGCFCESIVKYIGSFYAELGGLDHLVFTGGIGENSPDIRERVCSRLRHMGIVMDFERNRTEKPDSVISADGSPVGIHVIAANEELGVARKTFRLKL